MRYLWQNGGKGLVLSALFAGVAIGSLAAVLFATWVWPDEPIFAPLTVSDVTINSRLEGIDGPAVRAGDHYNGTIEICNRDDERQTITFIIQLERLSDPVHFVSFGSVEFPADPGCMTFTGDSAPLPEEVASGLWRESSSAIVQRGDQKQTVAFVSDAFEVVP